jgi:hypothetical protein
VKEMTAQGHKPNMNNDDMNLDQRLQAAFSSQGDASGDTSMLDPGELAQRKPRARNPRTTKLVSVGSLGGLASLAVLSLVVTNVMTPTQAPLFALANSGGGVSEMAASDARLGWWVEYEYSAGEGLSQEPGRGPVYQLVLEGDPTTVLQNVSSQFDLVGEPRKSQYFDEFYPSYVIGEEDWTGPSLSVTWNGTGTWIYSNPAAYPQSVCQEVPAPDGSEESYIECENPVPAGPLPSASEAREQAAKIFQATGLNVTPGDIRVLSQDEWGVGVSASLVVDGIETALEWSIYWAPGPVLASAMGQSVSVVNRGEFDTISPFAAVDRLSEGVWWGSPSPSYYNYDVMVGTAATTRMAEDPDAPVTDEPREPGDEEAPGEEVEQPVVEPEIPLEPEFPEEPEIIQLTVVSAEATLLLVWDAAGNAWLVPGYVMRYSEDDWGWTTVISLIEGVIEIPEPMPIGIMPLPEPYFED